MMLIQRCGKFIHFYNRGLGFFFPKSKEVFGKKSD